MKLFNFKQKPVLVCFHGFGRRQQDEFIPLKKYFSDYEVVIPELYDITNENDNDWVQWIHRAEKTLDEVASQGRDIICIGFSMGGVVASYCANRTNVKKLILLAPAFEYINLNNAADVVTSMFEKKEKVESIYPELPSTFTTTFTNLVNNCRIAVDDISVPTLIFHGLSDEVIQPSSSRKYYKKMVTTEKRLILIEDVEHRILDNLKHSQFVLQNMKEFIENKIK